MHKLKYYSVVIHYIIILLFIYPVEPKYYLMLLTPILHTFILINDSSCYSDHCHPTISKNNDFNCPNCGMKMWIRMRHCFKCQRCIHKYDHHCVLVGICVGEFNQKYYIMFLYTYMANLVVMISHYSSAIHNQVSIDFTGIQTLSKSYYLYAFYLIVLYYNVVLIGYLIYYHTWYILSNQTTWEYFKRDSIPYLRNLAPEIHNPFSLGIWGNLKQLFTTNRKQPINWKLIL